MHNRPNKSLVTKKNSTSVTAIKIIGKINMKDLGKKGNAKLYSLLLSKNLLTYNNPPDARNVK